MSSSLKKVELLAPAGSRDAFIGALSAGADAVYLGGERFGARAYAENFSTPELLRVISEAHVLGRKVYLTANVLTRERELSELIGFVRELAEAGLDGAIVQDLGVMAALRRECPRLPLHASTQLSVTSAESVRFLRRLGACRVVPARELSLAEISTLRKEDSEWIRTQNKGDSPVEIEAFIHGAMCYSYSGRCLLSSFLGGRSGNRGRCAGTCRLPYRILDGDGRPVGPDASKKECYPLSMKDLCVLPVLPALIDAGITSFKIEGRMKKPAYAAGVTAVYRKYIDRCYEWIRAGRPGEWKIEQEDLDRLRALYIRTDLGTGYYYARNGRELVTIGKPGYAGTDPALEEEIRKLYLSGLPKRKITGKAVFRIGRPSSLAVELLPEGNDGQKDKALQEQAGAGKDSGSVRKRLAPGAGMAAAVAHGMEPQAATGRPLGKQELAERLEKTGDSLFSFEGLKLEADEGIFLPVSAVNALRRSALSELSRRINEQYFPGRESAVCAEDPGKEFRGSAVTRENRVGAARREQELWALVSTRRQLEAAYRAGCSRIIVDGEFPIPSAAGADGIPVAENSAGREERPSRSAGLSSSGKDKTCTAKKTLFYCALPPVFRVSERKRIQEMIRGARRAGFSGVLVRTLEELELVLEEKYEGDVAADASLYSWNGTALALLARHCSWIICSHELSRRDLLEACGEYGSGVPHRKAPGTEELSVLASLDRDVSSFGKSLLMEKLVLPVYGRVPVMETAGCVRKTENLCAGAILADAVLGGSGQRNMPGPGREDCFCFLEDRKGKKLPVRCRCSFCSNTIYNAVPLSLHRSIEKGQCGKMPTLLCMFTTEGAEETGELIRYYSRLIQKEASRSAAHRGGGQLPPPSCLGEYTRGHYREGAQ